MTASVKTAKRQKYLPVPLTILCLTNQLPVDVYWCLHPGAEPVLLRGQNIEVADDEFPKLLERGVETVYIPRDQGDVFQKHLQDNVQSILNNDDIPITQRMSFLNSTGRTSLQEVFRSDNLEKTLESVSALSEYMTSFIAQNEVVASELFDVLQHDYHTYTHSFNVASYAMLLAMELGLGDQETLRNISMGGLLHDLGKLRIPNHILTKKDRLTELEWHTIQRHPTDGFTSLAEREEMTFDQLMIVYQHHEKLDGSGYPVGIDGEDIHVLARVCSVVDIFEALTSHRPYRTPVSAKEALEILDQQATNNKLDGEMVTCWKSLMKH